ncbi:MAG: hypothetical protein JWN38_716 [Candidatus Saccharibacteria bacterium]|nr:hypothetical protein [Candidatus Saccharibacteria bacterium]
MQRQNKQTKKSRSTPNKKPFFIAVAVVLVIALAGIGYGQLHHHSVMTSSTKGSKPKSTVNLSPPTATDKQESEQHKDDIAKQAEDQTPRTTNSDGRLAVTPTITYVDKTTVNAYVTGVFEDDGTCTATLTQGAQTITRTSSGFKNASYTQCTPISLSDVSLGSSPWSVTVSYNSSTATGISSAETLTP